MAKQQAKYAADPEPIRARNRAWARSHKDHKQAYDAAYYQANQEQIKANIQAWRIAHPVEVRAMSKRQKVRRRGAQRLELFTVEEICQRDAGICQLCNQPIDPTLSYQHPLSLTLDHVVPIVRGGVHSRDNVQLAHRSCNSKKGISGVGTVLPEEVM